LGDRIEEVRLRLASRLDTPPDPSVLRDLAVELDERDRCRRLLAEVTAAPEHLAAAPPDSG
jgi:hypothetical protein